MVKWVLGSLILDSVNLALHRAGCWVLKHVSDFPHSCSAAVGACAQGAVVQHNGKLGTA